jgi:hypothetical protein
VEESSISEVAAQLLKEITIPPNKDYVAIIYKEFSCFDFCPSGMINSVGAGFVVTSEKLPKIKIELENSHHHEFPSFIYEFNKTEVEEIMKLKSESEIRAAISNLCNLLQPAKIKRFILPWSYTSLSHPIHRVLHQFGVKIIARESFSLLITSCVPAKLESIILVYLSRSKTEELSLLEFVVEKSGKIPISIEHFRSGKFPDIKSLDSESMIRSYLRINLTNYLPEYREDLFLRINRSNVLFDSIAKLKYIPHYHFMNSTPVISFDGETCLDSRGTLKE